ncbi:hypothetical protein HOY80DRAFT_721198 [Tuber brumale]|nr:hypothetical protein HOY80DRAFT_721198 [Tuber brumale]
MVRLLFFCISAPLHNIAGCFVFFPRLFYFVSYAQLGLFFPSFSSCPWLLWGVLEFKLAGVPLLSFLSLFSFPSNRVFPHYQLPNLVLSIFIPVFFFHTLTNILPSHPGLYRMGWDYMLNRFSSIFLIT